MRTKFLFLAYMSQKKVVIHFQIRTMHAQPIPFRVTMKNKTHFDWSNYQHEIRELPIDLPEIIKRFPTHELHSTLPARRERLSIRGKLQEFFERNAHLEVAFRAILDDMSENEDEVYVPNIQPAAFMERATLLLNAVSGPDELSNSNPEIAQQRLDVRNALEEIMHTPEQAPLEIMRQLSTLVAEVGFAYEYLDDLNTYGDYRDIANAAFRWAQTTGYTSSSLDEMVAAFIAQEVIEPIAEEEEKMKSA